MPLWQATGGLSQRSLRIFNAVNILAGREVAFCILMGTMTTQGVFNRAGRGWGISLWALSASAVVVTSLLTSGCASKTPSLAPTVIEDPFPVEDPPPYVLQVGDIIGIRFWDNPELDEEMTIRPDGMISMP